jgi:Pyruvate/2-oxoacid:ferredoxin oxidoreductase gamma subunit
MEREVVMTGLGGQGIQLLAKLLAHAAIREGRQVMTFGLFMGMIRGGSSEATVVVADDAVVAPPIVPRAWAFLAMHGSGLPALEAKARAGGVLVLNATLAPDPPGWDGVRRLAVPAAEIAKTLGQPLGAGMIALGALAGATGLVAPASLAAALADVVPPHRRKLVDANAACIARGAEWGAQRGGPPAWDGVVCSPGGEST